MNLDKYKKKRDFKKTFEPRAKIINTSQNRFVIQEHEASHLHYDFRLEMDGVLKSWAVPKGVPIAAGIKRLAVQVEDHPVAYLNFSGIIPAGEYGAGTVLIWDSGKYKVLEGNLKRGSMKIKLDGKRIKGEYVLVKMKDDNNWLIYKI
jgi:bifunctional non-homologous end joining protein LigD